ncbi:glucosaminidase domain-containing protein [Winogradskyella marincola]|uniref:Peptidoglycan hydrolase n=1 Tax=Winogradskyella marincola TaxID=3037795 RepID=A0ABT6G3U3_9FLAO|nr:glucosaminidase domain-containing protein [Winogradskyella sp. YYF002]MDG4716709.1 glucosaminidase domain-containing protein [Winogradskyella sp. YYF002]
MASNKIEIKFKHIALVTALVVFSCGPKKGIVTKKRQQKEKVETVEVVKTEKPEEVKTPEIEAEVKPPSSTAVYIATYADIAKEEMRRYKIPASITLAQGILESASGKGRLAVKANNHFGIKCHGWTGAKIYHDDDRSQECFRKYKEAKSSYEDHSKFLTGRGRYADLFKLKQDDYKGWARGLKKAGYATDRKYPDKLISLIERYKLYEYDEEVLGSKKDEIKIVRVNSGTKIHIVEKGDTLYSLSKRYNTTVDAIKSTNRLSSNSLAIGQELKIPN